MVMKKLRSFIMNNNQALRYRFLKIKNENHQFIIYSEAHCRYDLLSVEYGRDD